ncbi:hypothetical protein WR25_03229 isoform A [Diploscapter pachys]|uniref:G-protein coupled receptors family 1 profile domain-containing protein n=1 Tax=Diploscapter pachys TaxID=2018661 RepID=A0A2A2JQ42_9BILA|nr:hypothetical protein WR25_03229 isoform A [Diploscapter pachys]
MNGNNTSLLDCDDLATGNPDAVRILLVIILGGGACLIGIALNSFLVLSFSRLSFVYSNMLYLFLLACFDILVEICFMLIFPLSLIWEYYRIETVFVIWHHYIRYVSTAGQVLIAASTMLIVAASFERYICSLQSTLSFTSRNRYITIFGVMVCAMIMKGSIFFELDLKSYPECPMFAHLGLDQSTLTEIFYYKEIWMFWCRSFLNVFIPFALLLFLNSATISNLSKSSKEVQQTLLPSPMHTPLQPMPSSGSNSAFTARRRKRDATRTLAALVSVYLLTNSLNLFLTIMEFINKDALDNIADGLLYRYLADLSSLLTISSTAFRLPVYYHCNGELRYQIKRSYQYCFLNKPDEKLVSCTAQQIVISNPDSFQWRDKDSMDVEL